MVSAIIYELKMGVTKPMYSGDKDACLACIDEKLPSISKRLDG
jgi:hypothetical protein